MTKRMSVIRSADGFEFVFICPETASRSAWVISVPAAIADVARVVVVKNARLETPSAFRIMLAPSSSLTPQAAPQQPPVYQPPSRPINSPARAEPPEILALRFATECIPPGYTAFPAPAPNRTTQDPLARHGFIVPIYRSGG